MIVSNHGASLLGHVQLLQGVRLCCIRRGQGKAGGGAPNGAGRAERHTLHVFDIITGFDSNTFLISSAFSLKDNIKPTRK